MKDALLALCPEPKDEERINDLLNASQRRLQRKIGTRQVNALIADFITEAGADRAMWDALYTHDDPYRWLYERSQQRVC